MKTTHTFSTLEVANAFLDGVNLVGDIDVETSPAIKNEDGTWSVIVSIGESEEETD